MSQTNVAKTESRLVNVRNCTVPVVDAWHKALMCLALRFIEMTEGNTRMFVIVLGCTSAVCTCCSMLCTTFVHSDVHT